MSRRSRSPCWTWCRSAPARPPPQALRNSIDLAQAAESLGYARYWFAEHHLNPGVAGTSPAVVLALAAAATSTIRIGSGAVQMGHRTALSTVEEFGLIDALHPGRLDLGLGRSGGRPRQREPAPGRSRRGRRPTAGAPNGLLIPPRFSVEHLLGSPRFAAAEDAAAAARARSRRTTASRSSDILALLRGTYRSADGVEAHVIPGEGAEVQVWILGSSGGQSAEVAGANGLRFAANYHVSPATVLEAVDGTGPRSGPRPTWTGPTSACPPMSWWPRTRHRPGTGRRLRPVGPQHPLGRGRHPVPDPGAGPRAHLDRRGPRARRRPRRHPVRRLPGPGRRPARATPGGDRRRRTDHHYHHPRPRRPGPLLRAARRGMAPPVKQLEKSGRSREPRSARAWRTAGGR